MSPHVLWIDNFSKILPRSIPRASLESFKACLWTVYGFNQLPGTTNLDLVYDLSALPPQFQTEATKQCFQDVYLQAESEPWQRYDTSISRTLTRIPLELTSAARDREDNIMARFFPASIRPCNIGANHVLLEILEEYLEAEAKSPVATYQIIMCDINIYNRILKVTHLC
jgi:hypothetical protein